MMVTWLSFSNNVTFKVFSVLEFRTHFYANLIVMYCFNSVSLLSNNYVREDTFCKKNVQISGIFCEDLSVSQFWEFANAFSDHFNEIYS